MITKAPGQTGTAATPAKIVTGPQGVKMIVMQTPPGGQGGQQGNSPQTVILNQQGAQGTSQPLTLQLPSSILQAATGQGTIIAFFNSLLINLLKF